MSIVSIKRRKKPLGALATAPPSKAHTLRAIFIAALADGKSRIANPLLAQDQMIAIEAIRALGAKVSVGKSMVTIEGGARKLKGASLFAGNSGVSARFLTAMCCLVNGASLIDGSERMRQRPIKPLVNSLRQLGAKIDYIGKDGSFPIKVAGWGLEGGTCHVQSSKSSQYLSALMAIGPLTQKGVKIIAEGNVVSEPYVRITKETMESFGAKVKVKGKFFFVKPGSYKACNYRVEGDYSSAAYLFAAAAVTKGSITVKGLQKNSCQGDAAFLDLLEKMGCEVKYGKGFVKVRALATLKPIKVNMSNCPDIVMPLAAVCLFADGKSEITGVAHLKFKESDRVGAIIENIRRLGGHAKYEVGKLKIFGTASGVGLHGAAIDPKNDHRIAMAFAIAGLGIEGVKISDPDCVKKSFPDFFKVLEKL